MLRSLLAVGLSLVPWSAFGADAPKAMPAVAGGPSGVPPKPGVTTDTPTKPADVPPELAPWTPRQPLGKAEPWEKMTDKDWVDTRLRKMQTGPFFDCTLKYPAPGGPITQYKSTAVRLDDGTAGVAFDRNTLRLGAAWVGGYLHHSDKRFGLLNTPRPPDGSTLLFENPAGQGWADPEGNWDSKGDRFTGPLPREWAKYRGLYLHGDRVVFRYTVGSVEVLESPSMAEKRVDGETVAALTVSVNLAPATRSLKRFLFQLPAEYDLSTPAPLVYQVALPGGKSYLTVAASGDTDGVEFRIRNGGVYVEIPASEKERRIDFGFVRSPFAGMYKAVVAAREETSPTDLRPLTKAGPGRWGEPLTTKLERGKTDGPFALDTLTIPYDNRFNALLFCTGVDFLPDGRIAMCTCHGDVWLVSVDEKADKVSWKRFATGLYHPLGLRVVEGKVHVLERGQLTRLHDPNDDGEADFYECVNNDWHLGGGEHSYDTNLETDPAGNFYFLKTGDTDTPTGGCLIKIAKDGSKAEIFCTGFRHALGLGMSPTGTISGADQEGNWMPATRIDFYKKGGFYGDMRAHHRSVPPETYDLPVCWLPREVDNSAGGQVWVPRDATAWGPLAGLPLHFSYGRCKLFALLTQELDGVTQGGVVDLGPTFLSGVCRGRFHPSDGHLYACGLNGWQTAAQKDGCLQRLRPTGKPLDLPVALKVVPDGLELTFSRPLDRNAVEDPSHYKAAWWGYRWSKDYGSKRYKVSDPEQVGQDDVSVSTAKLSSDGRTIHLSLVGGMKPAMQMQVGYNVAASDGKKVTGMLTLTAHKTGK